MPLLIYRTQEAAVSCTGRLVTVLVPSLLLWRSESARRLQRQALFAIVFELAVAHFKLSKASCRRRFIFFLMNAETRLEDHRVGEISCLETAQGCYLHPAINVCLIWVVHVAERISIDRLLLYRCAILEREQVLLPLVHQAVLINDIHFAIYDLAYGSHVHEIDLT